MTRNRGQSPRDGVMALVDELDRQQVESREKTSNLLDAIVKEKQAVGEPSRPRWNRDQISEMGSLDRLSLVFLQRECRARRSRPPG